MEVHAHTHTERKKWTHYLWEFLMLFLAVFCGFLAENEREHLVENRKEKKYIISMMEDLKKDSAFLTLSMNKLIPFHSMWLDSAIHLLQLQDLKGKNREIYQAYFLDTAWDYDYFPTQRTLSQLQSAGYNLIRNKNAAKAISQLEDGYNFYYKWNAYVQDKQNEIDFAAGVFADKNVVDTISFIAFRNVQYDPLIDLKLSDIPLSATINATNKEALKNYVEKLRSYSFYLQANIKNEHVLYLNFIRGTMDIIRNEYNLQ
jgi:hypothetical protein